jgi:phosphoribosylformylglycinamidine (FGAM) synthase-like amidotransferase family enzyme
LKIPISHAEGRFYNDEETINNLIKIDQIILNTSIKMEL